ncbi:MAG: TonB-dependent receptor [Phaeodactylibacter xiamenensis]|uniref:Ferric aerobactin receptor n=1 Tax=Phaeodactylibacter xiamenensis TaxID=1524460 RepID=A0A098S000_9BACT|nr:TonB-dependent receptor [Phaeodactylibacter xiamenensis]KGE85436.1 ferric aerobactin receptor [Phaeodactylibacter xiamenensis]MCR9053482.1 TonB-dependent receptor [bacterium]
MKVQHLLTLWLGLLLSPALWAQSGIIKGQVTDALNNEPIAFANVLLLGTDIGTTTDVDGNFEITGLEPKLYDVRASYLGYTNKTEYEVQVTNSKPAIVNLALSESAQDLEEVVVKASPFTKTEESPLSLRTIGVAEIQRNPGGNRDISRVIQTLPGVTTPAGFRNDLIIRGGAPNENRFYLDDVEVPTINHFATQGASGGPVGLINVNFIREVEFYSGAFPSNRGNTLSSVLEFKQRDGRDDRIGGTFLMSATDVGVTLEGPIGDKTTFLASARRSYLQFLFDVIGLPFLPTYNDFQVKVKHKFNKKNELTFIGLGALDQFQLNLDANETEEQQFLLNQLPVSPQWNYTNGLVYKHYADNGFWTFVVSRNMLNNESEKYLDNDDSSEENLTLRYKSQEIENKLRVEHDIRFGDFKLNYGLGYQYVKYNVSTFNRIFTSAGPQTIDFASNFDLNRYALFAQGSQKFVDERLTLSLGFRMDANDYSTEMSNLGQQFSPRFSASYALTERLAVNFNTGIYYQLPPYTILGYQEDGVFVNRENGIKYIRNDHVVAGFEYNTASNSKISIEGYYKYYYDYPFLLRDSLTLANLGGDFGVLGNEPVVPRSEGRSYGLEFLFQQRLYKGFYGIASYTLGWSEFEDKNGNFVPSSWDARHIANIVIGKRFEKNWEVGVNWRFQTGLPFTPFDRQASALVLNWQANGRGIRDFDLLNTRRADLFSAIDIRVDKKWFFDKWSLNIFLDIENVTGNGVGQDQLILDRPLDENGQPVGGGIIVNPDAPINQQQFQLKTINDATGTVVPSIGLQIEI